MVAGRGITRCPQGISSTNEGLVAFPRVCAGNIGRENTLFLEYRLLSDICGGGSPGVLRS